MRNPSTKVARAMRRAHGVFYTPADVAEHMAQSALDNIDLSPNALRVFDPACGTGVFLRATLGTLHAQGADQTSMKTALFLAEQLERLHRHGIDTFIVRGNHDAESKITRELVFREGVKVFSSAADVEMPKRPEGSMPVAIHGLSFAKPHAPESLLKKYKAPLDRHVNIGMMHTSLFGTVGHDRYAPCSPEDLHASQFDYWALGHIHKRSVIRGNAVIVMPGNPQGRNINVLARISAERSGK